MDGDEEALAVEAVHLDQPVLVGDGAVDHEEDEVVVLVDLRALAEVLGVLDGERVELEDVAEDLEVVAVGPVEVEPEEPPLASSFSTFSRLKCDLLAPAVVDDHAAVRRRTPRIGLGVLRAIGQRISCNRARRAQGSTSAWRLPLQTWRLRRDRFPSTTDPTEATMSSAQARSDAGTDSPRAATVDMKLEVVVIPVSDVDRAAEFYERLGWRKDADIVNGDSRLLQFTPPGSPCSIIFGTRITPSAPGSTQFLHLVVSDIEAARDELVANGAEPSEVYHDAGGGYNRFDPDARASGPDPERRSYASFMTFNDPDGNGWLLQEITDTASGPDRSGRDGVRLHFGSRERDAACVDRRTVSTRSASVRPTRTGQSGTPRTWWPSRPAGSCPHERLRRDRDRRPARRASTAPVRWPKAACASRSSSASS